MNETLAAIAAVQQELDEVVEESRADDLKREQEFAESARKGELGVEWQRLQQRIDLGQTTREDIISGVDESAAARVVQATARENLAKIHDDLAAERTNADDDADQVSLTQISQMQSDLARRIEELQIRAEAANDQR